MKKLFLISIIALGLSSCNKKEAPELKFNVTTEKISYNVNDTVVFKISGNPDQVTFYSGETGKKYELRDGEIVKGDTSLNLSFSTQRRYGLDTDHPQSLRFFVSQTFNGNYSTATFNESDWIDVTDKFTLSPIVGNDVDYTPSGTVNVNNLGVTLDKSKPIYFAFRYKSGENKGSTHPRWYVNTFNLISKNALTGDPLTIGNVTSMNWNLLKLESKGLSWTYAAATGIRVASIASTVAAPAPASLTWAVSKPVEFKAFEDVNGINRGTALKNMSTRLDEYTYVYTQPGTYKVTFVASNENVYGGGKVVKEVEIVVNP